MEHPATGLGKPERLRHQLSGCWSRRINLTDRMVYSVDEENNVLTIYQLRYHY
nr:MAG TPA: YoeB-like toxin [Caudoviricetes sp.]